MIIILLIVIVGTYVHDPIHRRLIDEKNNDDDNSQKRIWCIVSYSSSWAVYNYIIHIFHFFGPFIINMISAVILIIQQSRQKANIHKERSYRGYVRELSREHRRLLIAPVVLVILVVPRLIISFIWKCMQSTSDSWLFLTGYFISFIPPMLTFIIFILPSEFYRNEFHKTVQQFRKMIQRRLHRF